MTNPIQCNGPTLGYHLMKIKTKQSEAKQQEKKKTKPSYPGTFERWVEEVGEGNPDTLPRRATKKFHGHEIPGWTGRINVKDIEGYVENKRLKFYLNRWRNRRGETNTEPTTQQIYEIMLEADQEEDKEDKKVFNLERLARSIQRNGVQEDVIVFLDAEGRTFLWDGNRRFFSTMHIMTDDKFKDCRNETQWLPCFVVEASGSPALDKKRQHAILTETNFVRKDAISWPTYIKAEEIWEQFNIRIKSDPEDPVLRRQIRSELADEYGLFNRGKANPRQVEQWVAMVDLSNEFKEYQISEKGRDEDSVDLKISSDFFWYFDELNKKSVKDTLKDYDKKQEVFNWLWEGKFPSFESVRKVPKIFDDAVALAHMRTGAKEKAFEEANNVLIANDPTLIKDKRAADQKIKQFALWLNSFKREDFRQLNAESLQNLKQILGDIVKMLEGLLSADAQPTLDAQPVEQNQN
jgi:hypothetical protein